jgi:hypothetical protein
MINPVQISHDRRRPQVPRPDELAEGVAAPSGTPDPAIAEALAAVQRAPSGKVQDTSSAAALGKLGGKAKARKDAALAAIPTLVRGLGLREVSAADFLPYLADAQEMATAYAAHLAQTVGGGVCLLGAASLVQSASLELAASRYLFASGDVVAASRLAGASRANMISARDEAARDGATLVKLRAADEQRERWAAQQARTAELAAAQAARYAPSTSAPAAEGAK